MGGPTQPPPTLNNPAGGPAQLISSLWTSYGPSILAGGAALLRQTAAATTPAGVSGSGPTAPSQTHANAFNTPPGSTFFGRTLDAGDSATERRTTQVARSTPPANNPARPGSSSTASSSGSPSPGLRERAMLGNFQEIKGGEIEGYVVADDDFVGGFVEPRPVASQRSSWFGGWAQGSSRKDGYEHLKSD